MKVKPLRQGYSRRIALSLIAIIAVIATIVVLTTRAKYRNTETLALATGTISYNKADLNIIAMYQESSYGTNGYKQIDDVPTEKYTLSNKSYCEVNKEPIEDAQIEYREGAIYVGNIKKRGTKCYIYFDLDYKADDMLAKLEATKQSTYEKTAMPNPITGPYDEQKENPEGKEKLYTTEDNYGTSYVFRGNNNDVNNWVTFANHTWRIIRINGDGTLRLIFQCATENCTDTTGTTTNAVGGTAYKTAPYNDNTFVGYYYGTAKSEEHPNPKYEEAHSNETPSNIANAVQTWYNGAGAMTNYTDYLDGNTGWCNDRTVVKKVWGGYEGDGTAQTASGYAPASRLIPTGGWRKNQYPTLKCGVKMPETSPSDTEGFKSFDEIDPKALARDLFTTTGSNRGNGKLPVPAALITSDEVVMAGGFGGAVSTNYWLYTNQYYWTMSPRWYDVNYKVAAMFIVWNDGNLFSEGVINPTPGVRPVVNLKADTTFSGGDGKSSSPFVVAER